MARTTSRMSASSSTIMMVLGADGDMRRSAGIGALLGGASRQLHDEGGALARRAIDRDFTTAGFHDLCRDPQPEAESTVAVHRDGPLEALEDPRLILGSNADTVVADP